MAPASHAEVYKWVDAAGQTHYSERKAEAQGAKTAQVKITAAPEAPTTSVPSADYLRAQSKFAPASSLTEPRRSAGTPTPPPSLSNGRENGSDGSRCALARDVLNGAVRHSNGKPTDQYDRDVAQSDVKAFCRSR